MCSRKRARFQILSWDPFMREHSTVRRYASGACGRTPVEIYRRSKRYVPRDTSFRLRALNGPQTFHQVTVVWKHLKHPNIVPLLGATIDPPQLISDRMPGGTLTEYVASHPDTDRTSLVSDPPPPRFVVRDAYSPISCLVSQKVSDTCIHAT